MSSPTGTSTTTNSTSLTTKMTTTVMTTSTTRTTTHIGPGQGPSSCAQRRGDATWNSSVETSTASGSEVSDPLSGRSWRGFRIRLAFFASAAAAAAEQNPTAGTTTRRTRRSTTMTAMATTTTTRMTTTGLYLHDIRRRDIYADFVLGTGAIIKKYGCS